MPYAMFLFICLVWSASFMLMKKAALAFSPMEIGLWRVAGGAGTLVLFWAWQSRAWTLRRRDGWPLLLVILAGFACPFCIQPWVVSRQGSAFMALVVSFVPLLTILISLAVLRVAPSGRQLVGVVGSLVCMAVLMEDGLRRNVPVSDLALAMTVPLGYAMTNVVIRQRLAHVGSLLLTLVALTGSAVLLAPVAALTSSSAAPSAAEVRYAIASLALLSVVGTGVTTLLFNKLIREHGPLFAGMTTNLVPLGAVLLGWLDAEQVTWQQIGALVGIVAMVTLVQFRAAGAPRQVESQSPDARDT
jgi:drug/metabolite transporter (DMT)-like permease